MAHTLPKLLYAYDALEPHIDARTMEIHHMKHHQAYIDNLNKALEKYPELQNKAVEELLMDFAKMPEDIKVAVRNHGGGHANHSLFWELMTPDKKDRDFKGKVADEIKKKFGSYEKFKEDFSEAAMKRFGSGWAWLVAHEGHLDIISTANQDSPLMEGKVPLLGLDIWEHAYYLRYMNKRVDYVKAWWNVVNWKKVNEIFEKEMKE